MRVEATRRLLQSFDFQTLFREELGWGNPVKPKPEPFTTKDFQCTRQEIAHLGGASVYEITTSDGTIPVPAVRAQISQAFQKVQLVHILIFIDKARTQCLWRWLKRDNKKEYPREHLYLKGQPGDLFLAKLSPLFVDISQLDERGSMNILDVSKKIEKALDVKPVTKKFYGDYQKQHLQFLGLIEGIPDESDRRWYASVLLNRLMFIYFLQKKQFLDRSNVMYLGDKLTEVQQKYGEGRFYNLFLQKLFFEGFAIPDSERSAETNTLIGRIKYLNGGLFLKHKIELKYDGNIRIPDTAFANLFNLFNSYSWTLNDTPGDPDNEINPDVLGYIFEKYINQKAFGAYYTPPEITDYLCEQTVYKLILNEINGAELPSDIPDGLSQKLHRKRYADVPELLINLDVDICRRLVVGSTAILPNLSLLDPSCGSGAFLVAAMKTLINIYAGVLGKIPFLNDKGLSKWKAQIEQDHPSVNYYIKKQIITNNLYGVDLMEEATEIAKLRLFLTLVASAEKVSQLEPLPNIDFNIMPGNSLIGLLRVNDAQFSNYDLFNKNYSTLVQEKAAAVSAYKHAAKFTKDLQSLRDSIDKQRHTAIDTLNNITLYEWAKLGIKYEAATWDAKKNALGKSVKRTLRKADIEVLEPFHWSFEFDEIMVNKGGFDAIITNPPWEVFKPNAKEFFMQHSDLISKKNMNIKDFEKAQQELVKDSDVLSAWEQYLSNYPHVSQYYRKSPQYINQISYVNGKKASSDTNLYKLFTEQCYNLLRPGGYCGIIIPSGIYSDLGTKQLRQLLFEKTQVQQLVSLSNEKFIFENVHHAFPFCLLSFEKGKRTEQFQATFRINPREAIGADQLDSFLHSPDTFVNISTEFIRQQSPESLSLMEVRNQIEFAISDKMVLYPVLSQQIKGSWSLRLCNEFHMTGDSYLYNLDCKVGYLPLWEGKMFRQFESSDIKPKYWLEETVARGILRTSREKIGQRLAKTYKLDWNKSEKLSLDYDSYRLAFRDVASSTNERTMIATVLAPKRFCPHTVSLEEVYTSEVIDGELLVNFKRLDGPTRLFICSILNSLLIDYSLRKNVSNHLSFFYVYNLPIPRLREGDAWFGELVSRAAKLICTTREFDALWQEVMKTPWTPTCGITDEVERNVLRAEIDAIVAKIYGLTEEEFTYILSTFPLVATDQKQAILNEFDKLQAMKPATVFMSYAHEDATQVEKLYQDLTAKGFNVWKDDNQLLPGENWEHKIERAMKDHEFVIICLSDTSVRKRGFVQVEWKNALQKQAQRPVSDVYIIPAKLNQFNDSNLPSEINALHYVDLSKDWDKGVEAIGKTIQTYRS